jgi:hypothetical protein
MKYSEIRSDLNTGDIVLFSGKGTVSNVIKWFTKSRWSHVGMVIRSLELDMLLLWESTTLSKIKDIHSGVAKQGVQLVALSERMASYEGSIGIRQLEDYCPTPRATENLLKLRAELKDRPYEQSKLELFKSAYDGPFGSNQAEDLSSIFCSEMVAEAYQRMGLISNNYLSNEFTPADFAGYLNLQGARLGNIIEVEA